MVRRVVGLLLLSAVVLAASSTTARRKSLAWYPEEPEQLPAVRYAAMTTAQCMQELAGRGVAHELGPPVPTIDAPVRLSAPLSGVTFAFGHPWVRTPKKRFVMDCRLAVALDDMARVVARRGVVEVKFNSIYRGRWARRAGERHPAGVAIDVTQMVLRDGTVLDVEKDFHGAGIGSTTCGEEAAEATGDEAKLLRRIVCDIDAASMFNLILTPHYDRRHSDHLHLEVRRDIRWFLTQ